MKFLFDQALILLVASCTTASAFRPSIRSQKTTKLFSSTATTSSETIQQRETWDRDAWLNGWSTVETESCYALEGDFPTDLSGTFFQNGHAKFKVGDELVIHNFDGDGMVSAITYDNGKAWFRNRFVETPGYVEEKEANKILYRGFFGTAKNKGAWWSNIFDLNFKTVANTGVLFLKNRLFALWEADLPFEVDPTTLETKEQSQMDSTLEMGDRYSAHYKTDPKTGNVCNFGILMGKSLDPNQDHTVMVMEHDPDMNLLYKHKHVLPGFGLAHDCAITENYFCLFQAPAKFDPLPLVLGQKGAAECITWEGDTQPGRLFLVPRGDGEPIIVETDPCFSFHVCNAFEQDGNVMIDVVMADFLLMADTERKGYAEKPLVETVNFETDIPAYQLTRFTVNPKTGKVLSTKKLTDNACANVDFPMIHPSKVGQSYQYAWCGTTASKDRVQALQGLAKVDVQAAQVVEKWIPEPHQYLSEVVFAARSEKEDDGYLVGYLMDGKEKVTYNVIFDAANVAQGPISKAPLQTFLSHALHGTFAPGFTPAFDDKVNASFVDK